MFCAANIRFRQRPQRPDCHLGAPGHLAIKKKGQKLLDLGLSGKTVLVTGASQGIGAAIARSFASEGCNIIAFSRRESKLRELKLSIHQNSKVPVTTFAVDLRNRLSISTIPSHLLQPDILVNVAGTFQKVT